MPPETATSMWRWCKRPIGPHFGYKFVGTLAFAGVFAHLDSLLASLACAPKAPLV